MKSLKKDNSGSEISALTQLDGLIDLLIELKETESNDRLDSQSKPDKKKYNSPAKPRINLQKIELAELDRLRQIITELQKKQAIFEDELDRQINSINTLLPLIKELLSIQIDDSKEAILKNILPIIDKIIQQKSEQDSQQMGAAISPILPIAISQKIQQSPEEIGKAIAPEIAISIQEQIRLSPDSISKTLGPEMGKAIKTQIELERDAMVDALYPVIGNTISKYMAEAINSINDKVENTLSLEGIKRKIRAKIQGVSEAELILAEVIKFEVQAIFLIEKNSGLVIEEFQGSSEPKLEAEMLAGMLTAIRSFASECMIQSERVSELNEIEYSDSKIILEVAGYCYLAVVVKGKPFKKFLQKIRETLGKIVVNYGEIIEEFEGDRASIPLAVRSLLEELFETQKCQKTSKRPNTLLIVLLTFLSAIILPWGYINWRNQISTRIESETAAILDGASELSVYRLIPRVRKGKLTLTGRVPNDRLRILAAEVISDIAVRENLELENQIVAVKTPPDPVLIAREVERLTSIFDRIDGVKISSYFSYKTKIVTLEGTVLETRNIARIVSAFEQIPGVETVVNTVQIKLPSIETRIYFKLNSPKIREEDISSKIKTIEQFLDRHPKLHLKIIGHSDLEEIRYGVRTGQLAIKRANTVRQALLEKKINPVRLHVYGSSQPPSDITKDQPSWLNRCVRFEVFIPKSK